MAITDADIQHRYSVGTGPGNSTAGSGATSLGGFISTTQIADALAGTLWDTITGDENAAADVEYRCEFRYNAHASLTLENAKAWISSEVAGGASIAIAVDSTAASALGSTTAQALTVANEQTAPAGLTFSSPTTKTAGVVVGNIGPGQVKALWWRRTALNAGAVDNDGATVTLEGDTAA